MRTLSTRGIAFSALVLAVTISVSGCDSTPDPKPTASTSTTSTPTPSSSANPDQEVVDNTKWGIETGPKRTDSYGTYSQVQVKQDSPLLDYNESIVASEAKDAYPAEDIEAAQKVATEFFVSEGVDSVLVFDASQSAKDAWLNDNTSKVDPDFHADVFASVDSASESQAYGVVEGNYGDWRHIAPYNINPVAYTADTARVFFRNIELKGVSLAENGDLKFDYVASYVRPVLVDGAPRMEMVESTQSYSVSKQEDGSWKLSGWANNSTTDWV